MEENKKGTWKKGDVEVIKFVWKGKTYKNKEEMMAAKLKDKEKAKK